MITAVLIIILAASLLGFGVVAGYLWHARPPRLHKAKKSNLPQLPTIDQEEQRQLAEMTKLVDTIFSEQFREELREHGRVYFDKVIGENAMFLQQDLRLTSSQINEYMKKEVSIKMQETFAAYEQSMKDAQAAAIASIQTTMRANEELKAETVKQAQAAATAEKERAIKIFQDNMGDIVNHYLAEAFGNQLSLNDQVGYILGEMEANKEVMKQDMLS